MPKDTPQAPARVRMADDCECYATFQLLHDAGPMPDGSEPGDTPVWAMTWHRCPVHVKAGEMRKCLRDLHQQALDAATQGLGVPPFRVLDAINAVLPKEDE